MSTSPLHVLNTNVPIDQRGHLLRSACIPDFADVSPTARAGKDPLTLLRRLPHPVDDAVQQLMTIDRIGVTGAIELILAICEWHERLQVRQDTLDDQERQ